MIENFLRFHMVQLVSTLIVVLLLFWISYLILKQVKSRQVADELTLSEEDVKIYEHSVKRARNIICGVISFVSLITIGMSEMINTTPRAVIDRTTVNQRTTDLENNSRKALENNPKN